MKKKDMSVDQLPVVICEVHSEHFNDAWINAEKGACM